MIKWRCYKDGKRIIMDAHIMPEYTKDGKAWCNRTCLPRGCTVGELMYLIYRAHHALQEFIK